METAEEQILKFLRLLCTYPDDIDVQQTNERTAIFEIKVRNEEVSEVNKYLEVIQAIVAYATGLLCDQFEVRISGK